MKTSYFNVASTPHQKSVRGQSFIQKSRQKVLLGFLLFSGITVWGQVSPQNKWTFPLPGTDTTQFQCSPALGNDGTVYLASFKKVYAIKFDPVHNVVNTVWSQFFNTTVISHGAASSPSLGSDGSVYIGGPSDNNAGLQGGVYGFTQTGGNKWVNQPGFGMFGSVFSTPAIGTDGTIYFAADDSGQIDGMNPGDGSQLWEYTLPSGCRSDADCSLAVSLNASVYALGEHSGVLASLQTQGSQGLGVSQWFATIPGDLTTVLPETNHFSSSPAIDADGTIYVGAEFGFYAVNSDGSIKWVFAPPVTDGTLVVDAYPACKCGAAPGVLHIFQSSPVIGLDGTIYVGGNDGKLYALNPNSNSSHQKWAFVPTWQNNAAPLPVLSSPAVAADGTVYITMQDPNTGHAVLFAVIFTGTSPTISWQFDLGGPYTSCSPTIGTDGTIYIADAKTMHAIVNSNGALPPLAATPWPMFCQNPTHTGLASCPRYYQNHFSGNFQHSLAAKRDGTIWAWGGNFSGQLGVNSNNTALYSSSVPLQVRDSSGAGYFSGAIAVSAGFNHSLALKSDGSVWAWGDNTDGELGDNTTIQRLIPVQVKDFTGQGHLSGIISICGGYYSSYALRSDGTVWAWGDNTMGSLPVQVRDSSGQNFLTGVISIAAGYNNYGGCQYTLALKSDGTVWAWGSNANGQLGINNSSITQSSLPMQVVDSTGNNFLSGIVAIAAGGASLALSSDGTVWAWGAGPLGNNTSAGSSLPVHVVDPNNLNNPLSGITAIVSEGVVSSVGDHSYALRSDGTVWAWGYNAYGQLGNNSTVNSWIPVQVQTTPTRMPVMGITTGDYSGGCVMQDLSLRAWGYNEYGWLGNDTQTTEHAPVTVSGPLGVGAFGL